ncbi:UBX domain-containing protein 4 [Orussus abietinus]|uniref:UBX domain-containing protein 4 n=1 Tax=Orussus abietinus TaxID=222816 RepID=UPI000625B445|nr:UBX domain-containing protein 4 [Orussus abietinus]
MKWFEGSINEAVATSKSRKAIFVVFVEGKQDASVQFAAAIDAEEVSSRLGTENFVAIKLESTSDAYRFFSQIYQLVPVPSIFFIGENGTPLEIVAGSVTASELASKIDSILSKSGRIAKDSSVNLIKAEQRNSDISSGSSSSEVHAGSEVVPDEIKKNLSVDIASTTSKPEEVAAIAEVTAGSSEVAKIEALGNAVNQDPSTSDSNINEQVELTPEEKLERVKQLIQLQKKQRAEEEQRKSIECEIKRRKIGQDVLKMRRKQQDIEIKQAHEERIKEKAAEAAAREKVRQQIAQDKLERKERELALQQQTSQQQPPQQQSAPPPPMNVNATVTRIQFRLPAGNPHMGQFEPMNTLGSLRNYVVQNIQLPFQQFTMSTTFPRRDLTSEDESKTLLDLGLVPTAVILILPLKNTVNATSLTSGQDVGFFSRFMWTFVAPILGIYNYFMGYFFGEPRRISSRPSNSSSETSTNAEGSGYSEVQSMGQPTTVFRRNLGTTTIRSQGNIHRLHSGGSDNDENNTWNGNSTQQM